MFFPDPASALREMCRVVRGTGVVGVQVWGTLAEQPAYRLLVEAASEVAGIEAVDLLSVYWTLGDARVREALFETAGTQLSSSTARTGTIKFPTIDEFVRVEVEATPLIERIDDVAYRKLRERAAVALQPFETSEGGAEVPILGHVVTARRV